MRGPRLSGLRLRPLADVFAYAQAENVELRLDATEDQVRRPAVSRGDSRALVSGNKKKNEKSAFVVETATTELSSRKTRSTLISTWIPYKPLAATASIQKRSGQKVRARLNLLAHPLDRLIFSPAKPCLL